jgi:para-aminobenzoate synthetase component 1
LDFITYQKSIQKVKEKILKGDTYLLNLTFKTKIEINLSLKEIFSLSKADFKLYFEDKFICFSPERFIKIKDNIISTYPMKGTIDADIPDAKDKILNNPKEMAEHIMMVDLMRNDLSIVSKNVKVNKFRFIKKIDAGDKKLLQVSSKISGELDNNWQDSLGEILNRLLPAGSISGTPKKKTIDIINDIENYDREFYSGVFGIFDGENLDSSVMIRFIEKNKDSFYYKSGGGITIDSDEQSEYQELLDKIYLPL